MPRTKSATGCIWTLALLLAAPLGADEDYTNRIGVSLGGGYGKYTGGNLDHSDIGPLLQAALRLGWRRNVDLLLEYRHGSFAATELPQRVLVDAGGDTTRIDQSFYNQSTQLDVGLLYSFNPEGRWTPQVFGGAGIAFWEVLDLTGKSSGFFADGDVPSGYKQDGTQDLLSDSNWTLHFGVGAEFEVYRRTSLQIAGRFDWLPDQDKDNTGASAAFDSPAHVDANEFLSTAFASVHYFFTERDSDQDGIANRADACPYETEDRDGYQDFDGCPDTDNDGDGVPDTSDKSPDQPEDKDGFQDEDGAPDVDNDADGIADAADKCPDQPEDKDGFQDEDGCPDTDNDGDGVQDAKDGCPDTPQGVPVDTLGCPTVAKIDTQRVLSGVRFRAGSAELEPSSFAGLDSVVSSLRAYPGLDVEIQGHTSDSGPNDRNLQLSQQRAEAVAGYLVSRGIERRRLTPIGYGEESPLVANDTPENRARNERIAVAPMEAAQLEPLESPAQPEKRE